MKKFIGIALIAIAALSFTGKSTTFEGLITYSVKVESADPLVNTASFEQLTGTELKLYVKGASIRAVSNGTSGSSGVHSTPAKNNLKMGNDAAAIFTNEKVVFAVQPNKEETILNKKCYQLSCNVSSQHVDAYTKKEYFLCASLQMENAPYIGNVSPLSMYKALENGHLPLKMVFEGAAYKVTYTATSVQEKALHDTQLDPDQN